MSELTTSRLDFATDGRQAIRTIVDKALANSQAPQGVADEWWERADRLDASRLMVRQSLYAIRAIVDAPIVAVAPDAKEGTE